MVSHRTQVSFKTDPDLLAKAKRVLAQEGTDMTKTLNLLLENIVSRGEVPLLTREELQRERLVKQLQTEVAESIAEYQTGGSFELDEIRREFGLDELQD